MRRGCGLDPEVFAKERTVGVNDRVEPSERGHASIGEVLDLLQAEFPDVTISKIRFLESQGLIEPERTASGYRKFYPPDVERLRWILRQQKDHYLPLRVIRGQLDDPTRPVRVDPATESAPWADGSSVAPVIRHPSAAIRVVPEPSRREGPASEEGPDGWRESSPPESGDASRSLTARNGASVARGSANLIDHSPEERPVAPTSMTMEELVGASGLGIGEIAQLEDLGLVSARTMFSESYYDDDALLACRLAAGFLRRGVEIRHLRMYKMAAEREADLFEQIVTPLLRRRDADARATAVELLGELGRMGEQLRALAVRHVLARLVDGPSRSPSPTRPRPAGLTQPRLGRRTDG